MGVGRAVRGDAPGSAPPGHRGLARDVEGQRSGGCTEMVGIPEQAPQRPRRHRGLCRDVEVRRSGGCSEMVGIPEQPPLGGTLRLLKKCKGC